MIRKTYLALALAGALPVCAATPGATTPVASWTAEARYRHEHVQDDARLREARADTLRLRLGYSAPLAESLQVGVDIEAIAASGRFDSTANGRSGYAVVADPPGIELNQAWLRWRGQRVETTLGRQRILMDNQRFIGNVGWRQNEQTFDAVSASLAPRPGVTLSYAWLDRVHRVFSDEALDPLARERNLDAHLANIAWAGAGGTLVTYGYWIEDQDLPTASTRTLGARYTGKREWDGPTLAWTIEAARQHNHAGNPVDTNVGYFLVEPSFSVSGVSVKLGRERLGGDGAAAFQTPLATLHAFNGWADKFLATPRDGLEDRYGSVSGTAGWGSVQEKLGWSIVFHDFRAGRGGARYGREWDASLSFPLPGGFAGLVKVADYRSRGFARDTRKLWLQLERRWP